MIHVRYGTPPSFVTRCPRIICGGCSCLPIGNRGIEREDARSRKVLINVLKVRKIQLSNINPKKWSKIVLEKPRKQEKLNKQVRTNDLLSNKHSPNRTLRRRRSRRKEPRLKGNTQHVWIRRVLVCHLTDKVGRRGGEGHTRNKQLKTVELVARYQRGGCSPEIRRMLIKLKQQVMR